MAKIEHDIVLILAADIASPRVVARIDNELELLEHQRKELLDLRKMAVRRHGDTPGSQEAPNASSEAKHEQTQGREQPSPKGSMSSLIASYKTDPDSPYQKVRFRTRDHYESVCRRIDSDHGDVLVKDINARTLLQWHADWSADGRIAMAHALIGMVRMLCSYGASILEDPECQRLSGVLNQMRFKMAKPRAEQLTEDQANAIRAKAHERRLPSIALAQAFQFDCKLGQKDVIGDWTPKSEGGSSDVSDEHNNWLHGIRWSEIDENLILRHTTSREQRRFEINLRNAPMVLAELKANFGFDVTKHDRTDLPPSGPVIIEARTGVPYRAHQFRKLWRKIADAAKVPKTVKNMDSRLRVPTEDRPPKGEGPKEPEWLARPGLTTK